MDVWVYLPGHSGAVKCGPRTAKNVADCAESTPSFIFFYFEVE